MYGMYGVLETANVIIIEAEIQCYRHRWVAHVIRFDNCRILMQIP